MFRLILLLLINVGVFASSITLADFAFIVQKKDKTNIVFASDVQKTLMVDFPSNYTKSSYMPLFQTILEANNLRIRENDGIYIVSSAVDSVTVPDQSGDSFSGSMLKPPSLVRSDNPQSFQSSMPVNSNALIDYNISFVSHKLDFLQFDNVKPLLDFSSIPYSYASVSKTITFKENKENKQLIKKLIKEIQSIDVQKDQVTLKLTIFDTNQNKLKEIGINPGVSFDFSLLSRTGAIISGSSVAEFKGSLKFLQNEGVTNISQSTSYLISDSEKLEFKKVLSIPFLDENYVVTNQNATNQSVKHKYKDIGFIVQATPTIVSDTVYLDFSLSIGNVVTPGDLPVTSTSSIMNKFSIKKGEILLLAGISKNSIVKNSDTLPFIDSVPILRDIFTQKSDTNNDQTFNVSIEIF